LPTAKSCFLTGLVLCAGLVTGCTSTRLEKVASPAIAPLSTPEAFSVTDAGESGVVLPEEVAVLPSSYAGSTPTSALADAGAAVKPAPADESYQLASLPPEPRFPNDNPARDVFPDAPEPGTPDEPAKDIVWAAPDTPRGEVDRLIAKYAAHYEVPETLVRRVVKRESNFNPKARNGPYWGLMQILPQTAKGMGYQGTAQGLLDAETNLKYAVKYLRGAFVVADGNHDQAVRFYARGYYYDAKRRGLLEETGLGKDRKRRRQSV